MRLDVSQVADTDDVSLLVSGTCPVVEHVCATLQAHWDAGDKDENGTSQKRSYLHKPVHRGHKVPHSRPISGPFVGHWVV